MSVSPSAVLYRAAGNVSVVGTLSALACCQMPEMLMVQGLGLYPRWSCGDTHIVESILRYLDVLSFYLYCSTIYF